jgi:hypothetical protein
MSPQKDKNSSPVYNELVKEILNYLQSIDTWYEYLVFTTMLFSLIVGYEVIQNKGALITGILTPVTKSCNLLYSEEDRGFISYVNLLYPDSHLGIVPCTSEIPESHTILKMLSPSNYGCRLVIISKMANPQAFEMATKYFYD